MNTNYIMIIFDNMHGFIRKRARSYWLFGAIQEQRMELEPIVAEGSKDAMKAAFRLLSL